MKLFRKTPEDLRTALGQCFWVGVNGTTIDDPYTKEILKEFQPGGFILFQRNAESIPQVTALNSALHKMSAIAPFIGVDQEGGIVERLHRLIGSVPPAMALAATRSARLLRQVHLAHSRILYAMGFNVNFTPVLDLALQTADNGLGTRCFSNNPKLVARCATEVIESSTKAGLLICGKHFPGLGDTDRDSHLDLPTVPRPWKQIQKDDLLPYKKLLHRLHFIMVNHALYPDKNKHLPASLSKEIVQDFLLTDWNYPGISVSDDLIMGAVANLYNLPQAAEKALLAGNHMLLICKPENVVKVFRRVLSNAKSNADLRAAIFHSCSRILSFKFQHLLSSKPTYSIKREIKNLQSLNRRVGERAATLLKSNTIDRIPNPCTLFLPITKWIQEVQHNDLAEYLESRGSRVLQEFYSLNLTPAEAKMLADRCKSEWCIAVIGNAGSGSGQMALIEELLARKKKVAVISAAYPLDSLPDQMSGAVASYWSHPAALRSAAMVLFGERKPRGILPLVASI